MDRLLNYLANFPAVVRNDINLELENIVVKGKIDSDEFHVLFEDKINDDELTVEKALYISSLKPTKRMKGINELMMSKGR